MSLVARILPDNPVLTKELRVRMRGARAYWIMFGYLGFLSVVLMFAYVAWANQVQATGGGGSAASQLGDSIFKTIIATQAFLVLFITPAITSGSLTIEREQRTMDLLELTRMSRSAIIVGKLLSAVSFTALLIFSSLPLISICFMLGSVDPAQVLSTYLEMLFGSFFVGAMGLMWSSMARNTTQAVMYTYLTMVGMSLVGLFTYMMTYERGSELGTNVCRAVGVPWFGDHVGRLPALEGTGFVVICALGGILMGALARVRLEMFPERKGLLLRGLTLLALGAQLFMADLWWLQGWYHRGNQAVQAQTQPPIGILLLTALLLMLMVPVFATGELKPFEARRYMKHLLWGWTRQGLRRGKLASGLPFLLIATVMSLFVYMFSFVLVGKAGDITARAVQTTTTVPSVPPGSAVAVGQPPVPGQPAVPSVPSLTAAQSASYAALAGGFPQAAMMLVAFVIGFSLLCLLLSVVFRNRWVAWMLAYLIVFAIWIVPLTARGDGASVPTGRSVNLYYLNPMEAIWQMTDPVGFMQYNQYLDLKDSPMWLCTTCAWLFIGGLSLLLTLPFVMRLRATTTDIPFEEMVANA